MILARASRMSACNRQMTLRQMTGLTPKGRIWQQAVASRREEAEVQFDV